MVNKAKLAWAVMENHGYKQTENLDSHLYLLHHPNCISFTNYYATNHPSGPNYRVLAAGNKVTNEETYGKEFPCLASCLQNVNKLTCVVNLAGNIALRHNPYMDMLAQGILYKFNFDNIDNLSQFDHLYFGWDDFNNAHSGSLQQADENLLELVKQIEQSKWFADGNILLFTWDESFTLFDEQHVNCFALSKQFSNQQDDRKLSHFDFCKTMYDNYGLVNSYVKSYQGLLQYVS